MSALSEIYRFLRLNLTNYLSTPCEPDERVVVSLTTTPDRINKLRPTLRSLIDQSITPSAIWINLPEKSLKGIPYVIPEFIEKIELIHINRVPDDLGPGTKLLPSLSNQEIPEDCLIVVVDDDQIYPKKLLETYLVASNQTPHTAYTLCGWKVPSSCDHKDRIIRRGAGLKLYAPVANILSNEEVDIVQGVSSYAVRKNFFDKEINSFHGAPVGAMFADDIWVSGHLAKRNVPRMVLKSPFQYVRIQSLSHGQTIGLRDSANSDNSNNNALYRYFEKDW